MHLIRNKLVVDSCCKSLPRQRNEENARKVVKAEVSSERFAFGRNRDMAVRIALGQSG